MVGSLSTSRVRPVRAGGLLFLFGIVCLLILSGPAGWAANTVEDPVRGTLVRLSVPFAEGQVYDLDTTVTLSRRLNGQDVVVTRQSGQDRIVVAAHNAEGFVFEVTALDIDQEKAASAAPDEEIIGAQVDQAAKTVFQGVTIRVQTDMAGRPLRVLNIDSLAQHLHLVSERAVAEFSLRLHDQKLSSERIHQTKALLRQALAEMVNQPEAQLAPLVLAEIGRLFVPLGLDLDPDSALRLGPAGDTVDGTGGTLTLVSQNKAKNRVEVEWMREIAPGMLSANARAVLAKTITDPKQLDALLAKTVLTRSDRTLYEIDTETGLPVRVRTTETVSANGQVQSTTVKDTRISGAQAVHSRADLGQ